MGIQNSDPDQSGYAKSFETSSTRRRAAGLAALALAGGQWGGCSSTSTPANGNGDDGSVITTDDGSPDTEAPTDDGSSSSGSSGGSTSSGGSSSGVMDATTSSSGGEAGCEPDANGSGLGCSCIAALYSTYIVRTDGILIWENNASTPQTILDASTGTPLQGILSVQEGQYHGCAAVSGGSAECWQTSAVNGNTSGQLGNGTTTSSSALYRATPVLTAASTPLTNVVAVASGNFSNNACAVTGDGKLWCWGDLTWLVNKGTSLLTGYAQAITTDGTTPIAGVSSAALGSSEACAILSGSSNSVWCWGGNGSGQLGQSDTTNRQYPTKVLGLTNPTKLATTYSYGDTVCALDGANVRCWGNNQSESVGSNTTTTTILSPTAVVLQSGALLDGVEDLQAGYGDFTVLRTGATLWTWGQGFQNYAANYNVTNVLAIGWAGPAGAVTPMGAGGSYNGPRYITSDGVYHNAMSTFTVNCNAM